MMGNDSTESGDDALSEERELTTALSVLYAKKKEDTFTGEVSKTMMDASKKLNLPLEQHRKIKDVKEAIRYFVHILLPSQNGEKWKTRRHRLASKVIMRFITHMDLDDHSCAQLLEEKDTFIQVCAALKTMSWVWDDEELILTKHTTLTLKRLVNMLSPNVPPGLQVAALGVLSRLAHNANCDLILDNGLVVQTLEKAILQPDKSDVEIFSFAIECLGHLVQCASARIKIANNKGLIETLVSVLDIEHEPGLQSNVAFALSSIVREEEISFNLVNSTNLVSVLVGHLESTSCKENDKCEPIWFIRCLWNLVAANKKNRAFILTHNLELLAILENYLHESVDDEMQCPAIRILTYIDPEKYNKSPLYSIRAKVARGYVNIKFELYKAALEDFESADFDDRYNDDWHKMNICLAKTKLGDYYGALESANLAVEADPTDAFLRQERGVLQELMGKYEEALEDLDHACMLDKHVDDYEVLKYRAFVNFKLGREEEASKDAEKELQAPGHYNINNHTHDFTCLGLLSVPQFLGYDLK